MEESREKILTAFGKRLMLAIKTKGYTQKKFAKLMGVSENSIINYCKGRRAPRVPFLDKAGIALEVPLDWLVLGQTTHSQQLTANNQRRAIMQTFLDHVKDDIDFKHWQIQVEIAKLHIAHYLAKELGAHEYDAWKDADFLELKSAREDMIRQLKAEGLTKQEENGLLERIINLEAIIAQRPV
ncbi:MAG: helix-turn-helix domain-containing protein [bacterium]